MTRINTVVESKERSILFSSEMVCALLENRKTQTRRMLSMEDESDIRHSFPYSIKNCRFGKIGDRLYVREKMYCFDGHQLPKQQPENFTSLDRYGCDYAANVLPSDRDTVTKIISPIYMPRWCCRIELVLAEVSIEHLTDLTERDAIAEGVEPKRIGGQIKYGIAGWRDEDYLDDPRLAFERLWNEINRKKEIKFADNPWVWVLKFKRV